MKRAALIAGIWFAGWFLTKQAEASARRLDVAELRALVEGINQGVFGGWFDWRDVVAVILVESSGNPDAVKPEPRVNDASIGLMQVLLSTARDRGFDQGPAALYAPAVNVQIGMAQLRWIWDYLETRLGRAPETREWIGAYNKGVGAILGGNQATAYFAKWLTQRAALNG